MAGPNLEVFKFAVYVFFPVLVFLHYGDPEWYRTNVMPVRTFGPSLGRASHDRSLSIKNDYFHPMVGQHVVAACQPTMRLCASNLNASRRRRMNCVRNVSTRPRKALHPARGLKSWCESSPTGTSYTFTMPAKPVPIVL